MFCVYAASIYCFVYMQQVFDVLCVCSKYLLFCIYAASICCFVYMQQVFDVLYICSKYFLFCVQFPVVATISSLNASSEKLTHNREYWNAVSSAALAIEKPEVSNAYNFC